MKKLSNIPRIIISGLSGGSGKSLLALGLARAWVLQGLQVIPFKKGPDYIDAAWLGLATGVLPTNLDPYFMSQKSVQSLFALRAGQGDIAVVEGNRGLFDGLDVKGTCSTAELGRLLKAPVLVSIDCTKMTRTVAAVVQGLTCFEEDIHIAGVILNRIASDRHRNILIKSIEHYTDVPVLGALPKLHPNPISERHMGLMSLHELGGSIELVKIVDKLAHVITTCCHLNGIKEVAEGAKASLPVAEVWSKPEKRKEVTIGYVHDAALWFYYRENLEALERAGAKLIKLSLLSQNPWPEIHGLYLGGGFPETLARELSQNEFTRIKTAFLAGQGLPIYAECGGFIYLCKNIHTKGEAWPMSGVLPIEITLEEKPQGLGYVMGEVLEKNPYHPQGAVIKGHEFHYSRCLAINTTPRFALNLSKGTGMAEAKDGWVQGNIFAGYTHIHALGCPWWADNFVLAAKEFKEKQK